MKQFLDDIQSQLSDIESSGLFKSEEEILSPQGGVIRTRQGEMLNLCANNYLGLANHPALIAAARGAMDSHGFGMASVRFICGTQDLHRQLEKRIADYLDMDDAILFASCFDANGAVFEPLLGTKDAVISDALNHASIIDGIRLCKAQRFRFANSDMDDLEAKLKEARAGGAEHIMIATDGVFSMDGYLARLRDIRALADRYEALLMVDDCHATGFIGPKGAGTPAHAGVRADLLTGTLGKALGGGIGGYVAGPKAIVELLRQRARPYLFSNSIPPMIVAASIAALDIAERADDLRQALFNNASYWRDGLKAAGFSVLPGNHPIIPVMTFDAQKAQEMARRLLGRGVYVKGFVYPVVPRGQARLRTQMNAALTRAQLENALAAFTEAGREVGVLG